MEITELYKRLNKIIVDWNLNEADKKYIFLFFKRYDFMIQDMISNDKLMKCDLQYGFYFCISREDFRDDIQIIDDILDYNAMPPLYICSLLYENRFINTFSEEIISFLGALYWLDSQDIKRLGEAIMELQKFNTIIEYLDFKDRLRCVLQDKMQLTCYFDIDKDKLSEQLDSFNNFIMCFKKYIIIEKFTT